MTQYFFLRLQPAFWQFYTITVYQCFLIKLLSYVLFQKYIYILALEMASPDNRHCANCIGAFSFATSFAGIKNTLRANTRWILLAELSVCQQL